MIINLSPYEKDRIVPPEFGQTEMGRDLLAQDYMLKQITASLIYPEGETGKEFWKKVYAQAQAKYGTTNVSINTFNKVWIVPEKAVVYENGGVAFVLENHLKVMLEEDYVSLMKHDVGVGSKPAQERAPTRGAPTDNHLHSSVSNIVREIVIPALTKEVNEGKNFAQLRQVFYSLILATWYKKKIKDSILAQVYVNRNKVAGVTINDVGAGSKPAQERAPTRGAPTETMDTNAIYQRYLKAFKRGVYNYIKEEPDPITNQTIPRKYFSGGVIGPPTVECRSLAMITQDKLLFKSLIRIDGNVVMTSKTGDSALLNGKSANLAMNSPALVDAAMNALKPESQEALSEAGLYDLLLKYHARFSSQISERSSLDLLKSGMAFLDKLPVDPLIFSFRNFVLIQNMFDSRKFDEHGLGMYAIIKASRANPRVISQSLFLKLWEEAKHRFPLFHYRYLMMLTLVLEAPKGVIPHDFSDELFDSSYPEKEDLLLALFYPALARASDKFSLYPTIQLQKSGNDNSTRAGITVKGAFSGMIFSIEHAFKYPVQFRFDSEGAIVYDKVPLR